MKSSQFPFHTLLLSIYPIAHLYAGNIVFIPLEDTLASLIISIGFAVFFLLAFRLILKSWEKAGMLCSLMVTLFFAFGHAANAMPSGLTSANLAILSWVWLILFLVLSFLILRAKNLQNATLALNVTSLALIIFPLFTIGSTMISVYSIDGLNEREKLAQVRGQAAAEAAMPDVNEALPDIYYIIFDGYERADMLKAHYDFDNQPFVDSLQQRGFYVVPSSRSNYLNTTFSLNTALNLVYFHDYPVNLMKNARYNLQTNYVNEFLRRQGYQVVVYDSGTGDSNNQYADIYIEPEAGKSEKKPLINAFESLLLRTTVAAVLFKGETNASEGGENAALAESVNRELDLRRARVTSALEHLPDYAAADGQYFLFAHVYMPHIPFLYGPGGEPLKYHKNMGFFWYEPAPEDYVEQYGYQIEYLNQNILKTIDRILETSKKPVVIVLQSDHGDDHFLDWNAIDTKGTDIRSSTLSAIYFSDGDYSTLYPTMSTVNTFRVVLNHVFGTQYPLLPDKVYYHKHPLMTPPNETPRFMDACEAFQICSPVTQ